ncbi:thioredoxin family protein [Candidatus Woesearchaeota archaeon]|nr:thioredoxin family protein [Candidatus Woesearchaeota archaeon]
MRTHGLKLDIGGRAPDFTLAGVDDKKHSMDDYKNRDVLCVVFMCNHCPYVQAYTERMIKMQKEFFDKVQFVGINSNDEKIYPEDGFDKMKVYARIRGFNFPYLRDADQKTAKAYDAQCTPEAFVFDRERKLRYHGRIDDNYQDSNSVKSPDLKNAIRALIEKKEVLKPLAPAIGCSIKWA